MQTFNLAAATPDAMVKVTSRPLKSYSIDMSCYFMELDTLLFAIYPLPNRLVLPPFRCSRRRRTSDVCQLVDDLAELTPPKGRQSDEELLQ